MCSSCIKWMAPRDSHYCVNCDAKLLWNNPILIVCALFECPSLMVNCCLILICSKFRFKITFYHITYCDKLMGNKMWEVQVNIKICSNILCSLFKECSGHFASSSFFGLSSYSSFPKCMSCLEILQVTFAVYFSVYNFTSLAYHLFLRCQRFRGSAAFKNSRW